jgi:hypothetical protein
MFRWDAELVRTRQLIGAPAGIRTPNQQIMRPVGRHQQGETKRDEAVFPESAAVKVRYILLRKITPSRHNHAIENRSHELNEDLIATLVEQVSAALFHSMASETST